MRGKKVGVWCCGNENELYAALNKNGMDHLLSSQFKLGADASAAAEVSTRRRCRRPPAEAS